MMIKRRKSTDESREQLERSAEQMLRQGKAQQALESVQKAALFRRNLTPTRACPQIQQLLQAGCAQTAQHSSLLTIALLEALCQTCADLPVLPLARELFDLHLALSQAYKQQGDVKAAKREVKRGLQVAETAGANVPRAAGYLNLCVLCTGLKQHTQALAAARSAVQSAQEEAIASSLSNSPSKVVFAERLAVAYHNLGVIQERLHSLPEAISWYSKAVRVTEGLENMVLRSEVQASLIEAMRLQENEKKAKPVLSRRHSQFDEKGQRTTEIIVKQPWPIKPSRHRKQFSIDSQSFSVSSHYQPYSSFSYFPSVIGDEDEDLRELEAMGALKYSPAPALNRPVDARPKAIRVRGQKRRGTAITVREERKEKEKEPWGEPAPLCSPFETVSFDAQSPLFIFHSEPVSATPPAQQVPTPEITPFTDFPTPSPVYSIEMRTAVGKLQSWVRGCLSRRHALLLYRLNGKVELRTCTRVRKMWTVVTIIRRKERRVIRVENIEDSALLREFNSNLSVLEILDSLITEEELAAEPIRLPKLAVVEKKTVQEARILSQTEIMKVVVLQSIVRMRQELKAYKQRKRGQTVSVRREVDGGDYLVSVLQKGSFVEVDAYPLARGLHRPPKAQFFETFIRCLLYLPRCPWPELAIFTATHVRITGKLIDFPEIYRFDATLGTETLYPLITTNWGRYLQVEIPYREEIQPLPAPIRIPSSQLSKQHLKEAIDRVHLTADNVLIYTAEAISAVSEAKTSESVRAAVQIQRRVRGMLARKNIAQKKPTEIKKLLFFRKKVMELEEYYVAIYKGKAMLQIESYKVNRPLGLRYRSQVMNWRMDKLEKMYGEEVSMEVIYDDLRLLDGIVALQPRNHLTKIRSDRNALPSVNIEAHRIETRIALRASKRMDNRMWVVTMTADNEVHFCAFDGSTDVLKMNIALKVLCDVTNQPEDALHPIGHIAISHLLNIRNGDLVLDLAAPIPSLFQLITRVQALVRGFLARRKHRLPKAKFALVAYGEGQLENRQFSFYAYIKPWGLMLEAIDRHNSEKFACSLEGNHFISSLEGVNRKRVIEQLIFPRIQLSAGANLRLIEVSAELSLADIAPFIIHPSFAEKLDWQVIDNALEAINYMIRTNATPLRQLLNGFKQTDAITCAPAPKTASHTSLKDLENAASPDRLVVRSGFHLLNGFYTVSIYESGANLLLEALQTGSKPLCKVIERRCRGPEERDKHCSDLLSRVYVYSEAGELKLDLAPLPESPGIANHVHMQFRDNNPRSHPPLSSFGATQVKNAREGSSDCYAKDIPEE
jgi:tetratricopeptide (TPR) repeat protein